MANILKLLLLWLSANIAAGIVVGMMFLPFRGVAGTDEHSTFLIKTVIAGLLFYYLSINRPISLTNWRLAPSSGRILEAARKATKYFSLYVLAFSAFVGLLLAAIHVAAGASGIPAESISASLGSSKDFLRQAALKDSVYGATFLFLIGTCAITPIIEETFYRSLLYTEARKHLGYYPSLILVSITFGLFHSNILLATIDGFFLTYVFDKEKDLGTNILLHGLLNAFFIGITFSLQS